MKNSTNKWKTSTIVVACLLAVVTTFYALGVGWKTESTQEKVSPDTALSLWTDNAKAKDKLVAYMNAITEEGGADFIPVENRIAVFDLDGTLFCETDPNYFDYTLLVYRVLEDENYKDKASDFEKETAQKIVTLNETGKAAKGLEVDHGKAVASFNEFTDLLARHADMLATAKTAVDSIKARTVTVSFASDSKQYTAKVVLHSTLKLGFMPQQLSDLYKPVTQEYGFFESFPAGVKYGCHVLGTYIDDLKYVFTAEGAKSLSSSPS